MRALATMYGIELEGTERDLTLDEFIRQHLNRKAVAGDSIKLAHIGLRVRSVDGRGRITTAGLRIRDQAAKT